MKNKNNKTLIVIKISGSIFNLTNKGNELDKLCEFFVEQEKEGFQLILVAGGGITAKQYIKQARKLGANEAFLDEVGIEVSRLNAKMMLPKLGESTYQNIPTDLDEIVEAVSTGLHVVTGGLHPGHSTNAVAALISERIQARLFINATDVEGIYSEDPEKNKKAELFKRINIEKLFKIIMSQEMDAGTYNLMDLTALKIIKRSKIPTIVIKCSEDRIEKALNDKEIGTKIEVI